MNFIRTVKTHIVDRAKHYDSKEDAIKEIMWNIADIVPGHRRVKFMEELTADIKAELQIFGDRTIGR